MSEEFDGSFEGTRQRQARAALRMSPLERLRWLEAKRQEYLPLVGLALLAERARTTRTP